VIFTLSLAGETIADMQLYYFKKSKQKDVCRLGLWRVSRHPNYFFEWLIWVSLAIFSYGFSHHFLAWVSPVTIFVVMRYMTGPYTEKLSLCKRGSSFKTYQDEVPMFFPSILLIIKGVFK